jgi:hypothetical protein
MQHCINYCWCLELRMTVIGEQLISRGGGGVFKDEENLRWFCFRFFGWNFTCGTNFEKNTKVWRFLPTMW